MQQSTAKKGKQEEVLKEFNIPQQEAKGSPIQLISISDDLKTFKINPDALQVIRNIEGDIGVVAVSGAQRTGKSFILNLLLNRFNQSNQGVSNHATLFI